MGRILNDTDTYQPLNGNPSKPCKNTLECIIKYGIDEGYLNKQEAKYLVPMVSRMPVITTYPRSTKIA